MTEHPIRCNPKIDLDPEDFNIIKKQLAPFIKAGHKIVAFGSRVDNRAKKFSDLDIAIINKKTIPKDKLLPDEDINNLREKLSETDLSIMVDIIDFNSASQAFQDIIIQNCVDLFK